MRKLNSLKLLLSALLLAIGCHVWGADGDTHDFGQSLSQQLNNNASIASITIPQQSYPIKEVKVTWRYNKDIANVVTIAVAVGSTDFGSASVGTNTTSTNSFTGTSTKDAVNITFTNNAGSGTGKGTFYVTNVQLIEGTTGPTLTGVAVSGTPTKTTYIDGDAFDPAGLVVTGTYNEGDPQTITEGITWGVTPTTLTEGSTSVSVTATVSGITSSAYIVDGLTVNPIPTHTATFYVNGSVFGEPENVKEGAAITFPAKDPADIDSKKFMGWAESTISGTTQTAPSFVTSATMGTGDKNFYAVFATVTGEEETDKTFYFEPFAGSAHSNGFTSDNVAATQDMFSDKEATVWSHYTDTKAPSTTSYATNLDGSGMSNGIKIYQQINNTTKTILEVKGIDISNGKNLALSLYNRRSYTTATLIVEYKIDNAATYSSVGGTIKYNSTNDNWKYCDGLTISGTGSTIDLKISVKVTNTTNRTMLIDDIKLYGKHGGVTYSDYCTTIPYTLTTADNDFYSLYLPFDAEIPDNVDVYTGELDANETTLTLHEVTGTIPAETAVLVKSPSTTGDFVFKYASETQDLLTNNSLKGVLVDTEYSELAVDGMTLLTLNTGSNGVGFYQPKEGATTLKANRAYLLVTTQETPAPVRIVMPNDVATAIENNSEAVKANKTLIDGRLYILRDGNMFDLNGRLVK